MTSLDTITSEQNIPYLHVNLYSFALVVGTITVPLLELFAVSHSFETLLSKLLFSAKYKCQEDKLFLNPLDILKIMSYIMFVYA